MSYWTWVSTNNSTNTYANIYTTTTGGSGTYTSIGGGGGGGGSGVAYFNSIINRIPKTGSGEVELPDGAKLIYEDGNYRIEDKDAKITYRASRNRAFNRYVNASDLLEEFLTFLGALGVKQQDVLEIPIDVFINFIIMRAAQQDGEPVPEEVKVEDHPKLLMWRWTDRCAGCGRFIAKDGVCNNHA